ncbi:MAG: lysophospholipid acyltransferase family protein, partial [Flavobacterium sp.]
FFHPIQWFCLKYLGYQAHSHSVAILNGFLVRTTHLLGTRYHIYHEQKISENQPIVWVCNHQSLYDIPPIIWFMRKYHPKFISKIELGKGIPSVSFNLRYGGSVLIDRKNGGDAVKKIESIAHYINKYNRSVVIFPEGTRSKTGVPKTFHRNGLKTLIKNAPNALFIPVSINNSWKMQRYGMFPLGLFNQITFIFHKPLKLQTTDEDLIDELEKMVVSGIKS